MKMIEHLRKFTSYGPAAWLIAVAALLPFERIGAIDVGGVTVRLSQVALLGALIVFMKRVVHEPRAFRWRRPEFAALLLFFAANALSLLHTEHLSRSVLVLGFTAFTAVLAVLMPMMLRDEHTLRVIRRVVIGSAVVVSLFGLWQFIGDMIGLPTALTGLRSTYTKEILGFTRIQSTALEPLYFANFLLLPLALALAWILSGADRKTTLRLYAVVALLFVNLVLTSSRGGYGGFLLTALALAWMYRRRLPSLRRVVPMCLFGMLLVFLVLRAIAGFQVTTPGTLSDTFLEHVLTFTDGAAFVERVETFSGGIAAWKSHPWIGIGVGGYGPYQATFAYLRPETGWAIVNNQYIELLAETGAVGLATFVIFIVVLLKNAARMRNDEFDAIRVGALAAFLGMLLQFNTYSTLYIMHVWFTIGLIIALNRRF